MTKDGSPHHLTEDDLPLLLGLGPSDIEAYLANESAWEKLADAGDREAQVLYLVRWFEPWRGWIETTTFPRLAERRRRFLGRIRWEEEERADEDAFSLCADGEAIEKLKRAREVWKRSGRAAVGQARGESNVGLEHPFPQLVRLVRDSLGLTELAEFLAFFKATASVVADVERLGRPRRKDQELLETLDVLTRKMDRPIDPFSIEFRDANNWKEITICYRLRSDSPTAPLRTCTAKNLHQNILAKLRSRPK